MNTKKTESKSSSQSAFNKRRAGLMKKASQLAILCDAEVAVFGYSNAGKLFEYASSNMTKILSRWETCRRMKTGIPVEPNPERKVDLLREEMEKLKQEHGQRVLRRDLEGMSGEDLKELEQQLNEGLLYIKDRKEAIMVQQLKQTSDQEEQTMEENETLRRKVEDLETCRASISYLEAVSIEYQLMAPSNYAQARSVSSPQMACTTSTMDANCADLSLRLGPSTGVCRKRKTPHDGRSNDDPFLSLYIGTGDSNFMV